MSLKVNQEEMLNHEWLRETEKRGNRKYIKIHFQKSMQCKSYTTVKHAAAFTNSSVSQIWEILGVKQELNETRNGQKWHQPMIKSEKIIKILSTPTTKKKHTLLWG